MASNIYGFTREELSLLSGLKTPRKIQDFLNSLEINFEPDGETCMSPRTVLRTKRAHCMEGAMLAAAALRIHGNEPLVLDLKTASSIEDSDHVVALFKQHGRWGAISKTNHPVLRYREPVYKTIRELAVSYFHEYFLDDGRKTLRSFSIPLSLKRFDSRNWMTSEEDLFFIPEYLDGIRHYPILTRSMIATLRLADTIEREATKATEWKNRKRHRSYEDPRHL